MPNEIVTEQLANLTGIRRFLQHFYKLAMSPYGMIAGLADESVCPTLTCKGLHPRGGGAFACQQFFPSVSAGAQETTRTAFFSQIVPLKTATPTLAARVAEPDFHAAPNVRWLLAAIHRWPR
jgi:hypothetical protein